MKESSREPSKPRASQQRNGDFYPPFYQKLGNMPPFVREGDIDYPFEDTDGAGDENKIRGNWTSPLDFLLSAIGFSVGFGNLWRFPYYCYVNGGAAYLIPYILVSLLLGLPLMFMEFCIGQFSSLGCLSVWKVCPLFKGVGIAMFIVCCFVAIYHNMITAWSIHFVVSSVRSSLPWATCGNPWNNKKCAVWTRNILNQCKLDNGTLVQNGTCIPTLLARAANISEDSFGGFETNKSLPSHQFFHRHVLLMSAGPDAIGTIHWQLALYLLLAWLIVFFILFKGVKSAGKVVYVATIVPYVVLLAFLVRTLMLPEAREGVLSLIAPRWSALLQLKTWGDAATQAVFSLGCSWGVFITLGSYNRFHNNCYRDAWLVTFGDIISCVFAAVVTYAVIGFMGFQLNRDPADMLIKEPALAFVMFAEAIARLPVGPLWSVLFFLMLILVTLDTEAFVVETVVTGICDEFPERLRRNHRHVLSLIVFLFYACGVALCTQAGMYFLRLIDYFTITWTVLLIAFFQVMAIAWVYGVDNVLDNAKWMLGFYPPVYLYWKLLWKLLVPAVLLVLMGYCWVSYERMEYEGAEYPNWTSLMGWILSFLPVAAIPATAFVKLLLSRGPCSKRIRELMSPEDDWGPALAIHRAEQFPLQIPEARRPLRLPKDETPFSALLDSQEEPLGGENRVAPAEIGQLPHFDRETAI